MQSMHWRDSLQKVVLVGGPAIVHTGAADAIADLIKHGYIGAVLAQNTGNALAARFLQASMQKKVHHRLKIYRYSLILKKI